MERIGVAVIGLGFVGPLHVEAVRRLGFADVVAVGGSTDARARAAADRLGVPHSSGDWRTLVTRDDVQVVHVCTPNDTHFPITQAALRAGKHVLSEKPLALDSRESAALLALARESGLVNAVVFTYQGHAMVKQARAMMASGQLGDVRLIHGGYQQDWLMYPTDWNWRVDPALSGASRAIADIGSHWFNLAEYVSGRRVRRLLARLRTFMPTRQRPRGSVLAFERAAGGEEVAVTTEDAGMLLLELDNGALASATISQVSAGRKNALTLEVNGAAGTVFFDQEQPELLWHGRRDRPSELLQRDAGLLDPAVRWSTKLPAGHSEGWPDALRTLFEPAYREIRGDAPRGSGDYPTFEDGHRAMLFVEAVVRSDREGGWVELPA